MKHIGKRLLSLLLALVMTASLAVSASAQTSTAAALKDTAAYLQTQVTDPTNVSSGGEWVVLGLARSGVTVDDSWYRTYFANICKIVSEKDGVLSTSKYTEYSRVVLALTAIGQNPSDVCGFDVLKPLGDYTNTVKQGLNGVCYALLALDSGNYTIPTVTSGEQATREKYVNYILGRQLEDGGWSMQGTSADPDMTAIALQALAPYTDDAAVKTAVDAGVSVLSQIQNDDGTFSTMETPTAESCAQVIIALTALGIDPEGEAFTKNGNTAVDGMMSFYLDGKGFCHLSGGLTNMIATQQCFCALAALQRWENGSSSLYDMSDAMKLTAFCDVTKKDWFYSYVYEAADLKLFSGTGGGKFEPETTMSRAMLVTVLYSLSGDHADTASAGFKDVPASQWYTKAVSWAASNGLVTGYGDGCFGPDDPVTREQITLILQNYTRMKGGNLGAWSALDRFTDSASVSGWAENSVSWAVGCGLMTGRDTGEFAPQDDATRAEVAVILCNFCEKGIAG